MMIRGIIVIVLGCGALQNRAEAIEANGEWMILSPRRGEGITLLERRSGEVRLEVPAGRIGMTTIPLGKLFAPEVGEGIYAIRGEVSVAGVGGTGYLEMWSHFPGGGAYFSRTLAQVGPLQGLSGTQPWRGFLLPFDRGTVKERPSSIDLNLVLPVGGIVSLRKVRLVNFNSQLDLAEIMSAPLIVEDEPVSTAWWTDVQAGWVGGLGGSAIGVMSALLALLAKRNPAIHLYWVPRFCYGLAGLGLGFILLGAVAYSVGQPHAVLYPLLYVGLSQLVIGLGIGIKARRMARQMELRRMSALDIAE